MTNPIPGADMRVTDAIENKIVNILMNGLLAKHVNENELRCAARKAVNDVFAIEGLCQYSDSNRAAAKVGANVAAEVKAIPAKVFWHPDGYTVFNNATGDDLVLRKDVLKALAAGAPAETPKPKPKDWPEDFAHENGNYQNRCSACGGLFMGHKRRVTCKECAAPIAGDVEKYVRTPEDDEIMPDCMPRRLAPGWQR